MPVVSLLAALFRVGLAPLTALFVLRNLNAVEQGVYYTFASLMSINVIADLGMAQILLTFAAHEWSQLESNPTARQRLRSLRAFGLGYSALLAGIVGLGLFTLAPETLSRQAYREQWLAPLQVLSLGIALRILGASQMSIQEGSGRALQVNAWRLTEAGGGGVTCLLLLGFGAGLWSQPAVVWVQNLLLWSFVYLGWRGSKQLLAAPGDSPYPAGRLWQEIWPLWWRQALSIGSNLMILPLPAILFRLHSPEEAGRSGMSYAVVGALSAFSAAYLTSRVPLLTDLLASKAPGGRTAARRLLRMLVVRTCLLTGCLQIAGLAALWLMFQFKPEWSQRFLSLEATAVLALGHLAAQPMYCLNAWISADKRAPTPLCGLTTNFLTACGSVAGARTWGGAALTASYTLSVALVALPWTYWIWRHPSPQQPSENEEAVPSPE